MIRNSTWRHDGFSLIELTVATAIFSMGLGGFSLLLLLSMQGTLEARYQTAATTQAHSLAETVLMNSDAIGHFVDPPVTMAMPCDIDSACTGAELAGSSLLQWQERLTEDLPLGSGLVCLDATPEDGTVENPSCDGAGAPVIKVFWQEPAGAGEQRYEPRRVVSRLPLP